jgi:hypothetical protein
LNPLLINPLLQTVTPWQLSETIRSKWNLQKPSMVIKVDFGTRHPSALATNQLLRDPAFRDLRMHAMEQMKRRGILYAILDSSRYLVKGILWENLCHLNMAKFEERNILMAKFISYFVGCQ